MYLKQNRRFISTCVRHDNRNNSKKNISVYISCECKYKFDGTKCNSNQWWNNYKCQYECNCGNAIVEIQNI